MTRSRFRPLLLLAVCVAVASRLPAQTHKVATPETVVRAIGIYEWTGELNKPSASRLVPISLYIDSHFEEAGVYLARPIPFALDTGFSYSIEESGISKGTLDLISAARLKNALVDFDDPWIGNGHFLPPAAEPKVTPLHQSRTLSTLVATNNSPTNDPDRPKLVNRSPADTSSSSSTTPSSTSTASGGSGSSSSTPHPSPDPSTTASTSKPASTSPSSTSTTDNNDVDRPTLQRPTPAQEKENQKKRADARKKASQASVSGPDKPLTDDPDRPTLRRHGSDSADAGPAELLGLPADMHQMVAVSDAASRPVHNFTRAWEDDSERAVILQKMEGLAREQLTAYEKANPLPAGADTTSVVHAATPTTTQTPASVATPDNGPPTLQRGVPQGYGHSSTAQTGSNTTASTSTQTAPNSGSATGSANSTSKAPASQPAAKTNSTTKPTTAAARRRATLAAKQTPPPPPEPLLDEQLRGYELSYGADPTFVYSAHTAGTGAAERFVTLAAEQDPVTHQLQVVLHGVTDAAHLDRAPEMRPLDAVDADASNRASLLVELRSQNSRQFALYRILSGRADQIFVTGTTE